MISQQRGGSICVTLLGRISEHAVLVGALQPGRHPVAPVEAPIPRGVIPLVT